MTQDNNLLDKIKKSIEWGGVGQYLIRYDPNNIGVGEVLDELESLISSFFVKVDGNELRCVPLLFEALERSKLSPRNDLAKSVYDDLPRKFVRTLLDQLYEKSEKDYLYLSKLVDNLEEEALVIPILGTTYEAGRLRVFSRRGHEAGHFQLISFPKKEDDPDFVGDYTDYFSMRLGVSFALKKEGVVVISNEYNK